MHVSRWLFGTQTPVPRCTGYQHVCTPRVLMCHSPKENQSGFVHTRRVGCIYRLRRLLESMEEFKGSSVRGSSRRLAVLGDLMRSLRGRLIFLSAGPANETAADQTKREANHARLEKDYEETSREFEKEFDAYVAAGGKELRVSFMATSLEENREEEEAYTKDLNAGASGGNGLAHFHVERAPEAAGEVGEWEEGLGEGMDELGAALEKCFPEDGEKLGPIEVIVEEFYSVLSKRVRKSELFNAMHLLTEFSGALSGSIGEKLKKQTARSFLVDDPGKIDSIYSLTRKLQDAIARAAAPLKAPTLELATELGTGRAVSTTHGKALTPGEAAELHVIESFLCILERHIPDQAMGCGPFTAASRRADMWWRVPTAESIRECIRGFLKGSIAASKTLDEIKEKLSTTKGTAEVAILEVRLEEEREKERGRKTKHDVAVDRIVDGAFHSIKHAVHKARDAIAKSGSAAYGKREANTTAVVNASAAGAKAALEELHKELVGIYNKILDDLDADPHGKFDSATGVPPFQIFLGDATDKKDSGWNRAAKEVAAGVNFADEEA